MRIILIWVAAAFVFGSFYMMVERKEALRREGQTVFLALAPADPHSIMQGDYMALNYAVMNPSNEEQFESPTTQTSKGPSSSVMVIKIDNQNVGRFVRLHENEALAPGEHLLKFHHDDASLIGAETYFIPEGAGQKFVEAKYGELKVEPDGTLLLVALCDKNLHPIVASDAPDALSPQ